MNPWPADSSPHISEPQPVVELLDGSRLPVQVVPISGFAYEWPAKPPQGNED